MTLHRFAAFLLALTCLLSLPGCTGDTGSAPAETAASTEVPSQAQMPDLTGMDIRWAQTQCEALGMTVEASPVPSDAEPMQVLTQSIEPGRNVSPGQTVVLTYAGRDTAAS